MKRTHTQMMDHPTSTDHVSDDSHKGTDSTLTAEVTSSPKLKWNGKPKKTMDVFYLWDYDRPDSELSCGAEIDDQPCYYVRFGPIDHKSRTMCVGVKLAELSALSPLQKFMHAIMGNCFRDPFEICETERHPKRYVHSPADVYFQKYILFGRSFLNPKSDICQRLYKIPEAELANIMKHWLHLIDKELHATWSWRDFFLAVASKNQEGGFFYESEIMESEDLVKYLEFIKSESKKNTPHIKQHVIRCDFQEGDHDKPLKPSSVHARGAISQPNQQKYKYYYPGPITLMGKGRIPKGEPSMIAMELSNANGSLFIRADCLNNPEFWLEQTVDASTICYLLKLENAK